MLRIKRWVRTDFGSHKFRQTKSSNWGNSAINTRSLQKRISLHIILFNFHNSVNFHIRDEENEANHGSVKRDWASVYWTTPQSDLPLPAAHTLLWDTVPSPTAFQTLPLTELSFLMHLPYSSTANPKVNTTPYPYFARAHGSLPTAQAVIRMWAKCYPGEGQATTRTQREHLTSLRGSEKTPEVPFIPRPENLQTCIWNQRTNTVGLFLKSPSGQDNTCAPQLSSPPHMAPKIYAGGSSLFRAPDLDTENSLLATCTGVSLRSSKFTFQNQFPFPNLLIS